MSNQLDDFSKEYSEASFWKKLKTYAASAGKDVIKKALILYYCLIDNDTPVWARGIIIGALGHFILPTDLIPDFIPVAGYTDDIGALASALAAVAMHIKPDHKKKAKEKLKTWFS
jgi:uncharacterized membrane protein YkvA (DUF1232 family)